MNVLITGISRGIGYELVNRFLEVQEVNILGLTTNTGKLGKLISNPGFQLVEMDYKKLKKDPGAFLSFVKQNFSGLDIGINNAGTLTNKPYLDLAAGEMENIMEVNFHYPVFLVKVLAPLLNQGAHIVNIGSMGGYQGSSKFPGLSVYSASKGALAIVSECIAVELADRDIACNCLCLGAVQTEMLNEAFPGYKAPVSAEGMSDFIVDFAINGNKYFNGKILPVALSNP